MRTATAVLQALIANWIANGYGKVARANLFTFLAADGVTVIGRYTDADVDLTVNLDGTGGGPTYLSYGSGAPIITLHSLKHAIGTQAETMELSLGADANRTINGVPWLQALRNGLLDGGRVLLYRFLADTFANTAAGAVNMFSGRVGAINEIGRSSAKIEVNSDLILLDTQMPRELQQPQCANQLGDSKCTVNLATFSVAGTIAAGSTRQLVNTSALGSAVPAFSLGKIKFTSGVNNGLTFTIRAQTSTTQLSLVVPMFSIPAIGDTFTAYQGCDHSQATCTSRFSNLANFRGAPFTPVPESVT